MKNRAFPYSLTSALVAPFALSAALVASPALAAEPTWGEAFYAESCASCHGEKGKADGPLAELLTIEVPDLTGLSARNDGEFPMLRVIQVIDGRSGMRAHEGPMPMWGARFREELFTFGISGAVEPLIRGRTLSLAEYLETLQE